MKKYCYFNGLLVIHPLISSGYSSSTTSVKNSTTYSPPLKQTKHTHDVTPAAQNASENKPNLIARFYVTEKSRRITGWQPEDIALREIIKTYAPWLLNNYCPIKKSSV
jgi:hypothetical protein